MIDDPIVEEVRRVREAHAARFNYDLDAIFRDIKEREKKSGRKYVSFPPRRIEPTGAALPAAPTETASEATPAVER